MLWRTRLAFIALMEIEWLNDALESIICFAERDNKRRQFGYSDQLGCLRAILARLNHLFEW